jgi:hypothetical protein
MTGGTIQLSPSEFADWKERAAVEFARLQFEALDEDDLNHLSVETVAQFLGIPVPRVADLMPVTEVGPRTRRVSIADYKWFRANNTKTPRGWKPKPQASAK